MSRRTRRDDPARFMEGRVRTLKPARFMNALPPHMRVPAAPPPETVHFRCDCGRSEADPISDHGDDEARASRGQ